MKDVGRDALAVSAVLAGVAGFVDAVGFLDSGGLFVSFMSGNTTQAAVDLGGPGAVVALASAGVIVAFVAGVTVGGVVRVRARSPHAWIVGSSAVTVLAVGLLAIGGPSTLWRLGLLAAAMGSLNTLFLAEGRARVAITYSTGTLVSVGLAVSALVTGGSRTAWRRPLLLWSALAGGAVIGALAHRAGSTAALSAAAAVLGAISVVLALRSARRPPGGSDRVGDEPITRG